MRRFLHCLPVLNAAALIFALSSMTHPPSPGPQFPLKDKVGHWMLYCVFGWSISWALGSTHNRSLPKPFGLAILIGSAYGVTDEFHQRFVLNRTCDVMDWLADALGASAAAAAFYAYESHRSAKANRQPA
jgi:VanZ family protein